MEKLGDTQKRQREEGDEKKRKVQRNCDGALNFLKEKADQGYRTEKRRN